jgi:hypothetical protein
MRESAFWHWSCFTWWNFQLPNEHDPLEEKPMKTAISRMALSLAGVAALTLVCGCNNTESSTPHAVPAKSAPTAGTKSPPAAAVSAPATAEGWGTIRGRVVFGGDKLPEQTNLKVDKDTEHCLSRGPIPNEQWVVNPENRGVRWAVVFLKGSKAKRLAIHDSLKEPNPKEIVLDQPACRFEPHVLIVRQGQKLVAKNPATVAHNIQLQGAATSYNVTLPPGKTQTFEFEPESGPIKVGCSVHPWMQGYTWVFEHPYAVVTDADGRFEIKLAPAGSQTLVIWQESADYVPSAKGRTVEVKADGVLDLGEILVKPAG